MLDGSLACPLKGTVTLTTAGEMRPAAPSRTVSGRRDLTPVVQGHGTEDLQRAARDQMALDVEVIGDGGVGREKSLCRAWRFETELLPLSASGWLMRDLRPIIRAPAGDVTTGQAEVAQGGAIRAKPVRHNRIRNAALLLQEFSQ